MGQATEWRDKATYYWNLSKSVKDYDLCEQYAEIAVRFLDLAEKLEDRITSDVPRALDLKQRAERPE
jgi:hypothetical protein